MDASVISMIGMQHMPPFCCSSIPPAVTALVMDVSSGWAPRSSRNRRNRRNRIAGPEFIYQPCFIQCIYGIFKIENR